MARLRWQIATWLDRLPGQCWTDLVIWVAARQWRTPWSPQGAMCRSSAAARGACYCGKLRQALPPDGE